MGSNRARWSDKGTFLALRHTCLALADCATYLLEKCGFQFVLLGALQSDDLESRFGWLRLLSGANYYISMRQVVESDRKIRTLSLLKFSKVSLSAIDEELLSVEVSAGSNKTIDSVAAEITDSLNFDVEPDLSDSNIIYYVSGAIARSVVSTTKCDHCRESLIVSGQLEPLDCDDNAPCSTAAADFLDTINRGGLAKPTEFVFLLSTHCWRVFEEIRTRPELRKQFLSTSPQRLLFSKIMERATYNQRFNSIVFGQALCTAAHDLFDLTVKRFFNCLAKNLVRDLTNEANRYSEPLAKRRKIAKLQSGNRPSTSK